MAPDAQGFPTDEEFAAETARRKKLAADKASTDKAAANKDKPDKYYAVKTGDTLDAIAKELDHEGEGQALFDCCHEGGISNGELVARHSNLVRGANGEAEDERGRTIEVLDASGVTSKTKLVEGQSLLLPEGW